MAVKRFEKHLDSAVVDNEHGIDIWHGRTCVPVVFDTGHKKTVVADIDTLMKRIPGFP